MRILSLSLRGIGPFPGEHTVDGTALGASGVFLLEGPTGSGKSTLIDALVWALYGDVAAAGATDDRIRSHFAEPATESYVDLVFETGGGVWRVRRTPQYQRPAKRGGGLTKEHASARLWRYTSPDAIDGEGEILSTRIPEVNGELTRILGLTHDQFTQTVVLPQGEFARFLRADTVERQEVLQRVFGTKVYEDLEKELETRRKAARKRLDAADQTLRERLAAFAEAVGAEEETAGDLRALLDASRIEDLAARIRDLTAERAAEASRLEDASATAAAAQSAARTARDATARTREQLRRRAGLRSQLAEHLKTADDQERDRERLAEARRAQPVSRAHRAVETAHAAVGTAEQELAARRAEAPEDLRAADGPALEDAREAATRRIAELAPLRDLQQQITTLTEELAGHRDALAAARTRREERAATVADLPARRRALQTQRTEARAAADAGPELQARLVTDGAVRTAAQTAERLATTRTEATAERTQAAHTASSAETALHDLRQRRYADIAGELAGRLEDDTPCPVCGATDHPAPARPAPDAVTAEHLEQAEARHQDADAALRRAEAAVTAAESSLRTAREQAEDLPLAEAETRLEATTRAARAATDAAQRVTDLDAELTAHDEHQQKVTADVAAADTGIATLVGQVEASEQSLTEKRDRLAAARDGDERPLAELIAAQEHRHRVAGSVLGAVRALAERGTQRSDREAERTTALAEQGFDDLEGALAAVLPATDLTALERSTQSWTVRRDSLETQLAAPELADLTGDPDRLTALLATQETALAEATERRDTALGAATTAQRTAGRTTEAAGRFDAAVSDQERTRANAEPVLRIANLTTGWRTEGDRVRLSTFVLMRRFDDVVAAANERLVAMSGGRYELLRAVGGRGNRKSGLDLTVLDRTTEVERVPSTLSGGETFYVSLALALGLADIVTAEAGGIELSSLFIDEGFGSLDPETLDLVLAQITRLADSGRTVGLISHVEDMKTRFAERIEVRRSPGGASTLRVIA